MVRGCRLKFLALSWNDMAGTSTPYKRAGRRRRPGIIGHGNKPGTQEHQESQRPVTGPGMTTGPSCLRGPGVQEAEYARLADGGALPLALAAERKPGAAG